MIFYTFIVEKSTDPEELSDSVYNLKRERVKPDTLKDLMKTSKHTVAPTTTASPISPHRRASIHRMRDRYKSQLLAQKNDLKDTFSR